jgi:hypothetical protein
MMCLSRVRTHSARSNFTGEVYPLTIVLAHISHLTLACSLTSHFSLFRARSNLTSAVAGRTGMEHSYLISTCGHLP